MRIHAAGGRAILLALILTGCSNLEDDDESVVPTPPPECDGEYVDATFVDDPPRAWAMLRQALIDVYVGGSTFIEEGYYPQVVSSYYLIGWRETGEEELEQTETTCGTSISQLEVPTVLGTTLYIDTVVPQSVIDATESAVWSATLEAFESPKADPSAWVIYTLNESEFGSQYWVMGADLKDPVNDSCPVNPDGTSAPDDPAQVDQDGDGNPGITTEQYINGDYSASMYMCSRTLYRYASAPICYLPEEDRYQITGAVTDLIIDQSLYGTDNPPQADPESLWTPNEFTFYVIRDLPDGASCEDAMAEFASF